MHDVWQKLQTVVTAPVSGFFNFSSPYGLLFLAGAFVFCGVLFAVRAGRPFDLRAMLRFVLPREVFLHRSAKLDYRYFPLMTMVRVGMLGSMVVSSSVFAELLLMGLQTAFGGRPPIAAPHWVVVAFATIVHVLAFELGYWFGHRIQHAITLLWEFHKTHHAAEILTPMTAARSHPIDDLCQANFQAATLGLGYGLMVYLFGEGAQPLSLLGLNAVFFTYYLTIFHLRHSHVWLPIRGWLGCIIQSPAHHQIHHSVNPRHHNKNLGFSLSLWDWIFGTLYNPDKDEEIEFGLGEESADFMTVADLFFRPFRNAARLFLPAKINAVAKAGGDGPSEAAPNVAQ